MIWFINMYTLTNWFDLLNLLYIYFIMLFCFSFQYLLQIQLQVSSSIYYNLMFGSWSAILSQLTKFPTPSFCFSFFTKSSQSFVFSCSHFNRFQFWNCLLLLLSRLEVEYSSSQASCCHRSHTRFPLPRLVFFLLLHFLYLLLLLLHLVVILISHKCKLKINYTFVKMTATHILRFSKMELYNPLQKQLV